MKIRWLMDDRRIVNNKIDNVRVDHIVRRGGWMEGVVVLLLRETRHQHFIIGVVGGGIGDIDIIVY